MKIKPKQYAEGLFEALSGKDEKEAKVIIDKFARLLVANNQASGLEKVLSYFNKFWDRKHGIAQAEIITARAMDAAVRKELSSYIKNRASAREVEIKETQDAEILGGAVIKYQDKVVDLSLRSRVLKLKEKMIS